MAMSAPEPFPNPVHLRVPAPPVEGQAMGMERYGRLMSVGGIRLNTPEGKAWYEERIERFYAQEELNPLLVERYMAILIGSATYHYQQPGYSRRVP